MRWRQMQLTLMAPNAVLTCGRGAFLPSPQIARSWSSSYRVARTNTSRTLSSAMRACPSESLRRGCFQIRGGWGRGWCRRQSVKHESSLTLKAHADNDDFDAEIREGALPRATGQTNALDIFSGRIKLQVICCFVCPQSPYCEVLPLLTKVLSGVLQRCNRSVAAPSQFLSRLASCAPAYIIYSIIFEIRIRPLGATA